MNGKGHFYLIAWVVLLTGVLSEGELSAQPAPPLHLHAQNKALLRPVIAQGAAAVIKVAPIQKKTPSRMLRRPLTTQIPPSASSKGLDKVKLLIGDQFTGSFLGYAPDAGLQWRHPSIKQALVLNGDSLARLVLSERPKSTNVRRHTCRVVMVNDDELLVTWFSFVPSKGKT